MKSLASLNFELYRSQELSDFPWQLKQTIFPTSKKSTPKSTFERRKMDEKDERTNERTWKRSSASVKMNRIEIFADNTSNRSCLVLARLENNYTKFDF